MFPIQFHFLGLFSVQIIDACVCWVVCKSNVPLSLSSSSWLLSLFFLLAFSPCISFIWLKELMAFTRLSGFVLFFFCILQPWIRLWFVVKSINVSKRILFLHANVKHMDYVLCSVKFTLNYLLKWGRIYSVHWHCFQPNVQYAKVVKFPCVNMLGSFYLKNWNYNWQRLIASL